MLTCMVLRSRCMWESSSWKDLAEIRLPFMLKVEDCYDSVNNTSKFNEAYTPNIDSYLEEGD
jgi:hypothetical protein